MRRDASALVVAALLLPACVATMTPSPIPRASTPPGLEAIAATYVDLVAPFDAATCAFNVVLSQSAPALADLKRGSTAYAASLAEVIDGLRTAHWPAELSDDVDGLIAALTIDQTYTNAMAAADTFDSFVVADDKLIAANSISSAAAKQLRKELGLPIGEAPCPS
jgi:hypothetical protein